MPKGSGYYYEDSAYPVIYPVAGDMSYAMRYEEEGWGFGYEVCAAQGAGPVPGGEEFEFIFSMDGMGEYVTISLWDDAIGYEPENVADVIVISEVPEPATIMLLGLGGLLLRRRKR